MSTTEAPVTRWRKKPVEVRAVQWTGDNADEIFEFAGREHFDVLDDLSRANCDDPEATAAVFDKLHSTWVLVKDGQWIIRGVVGEFYPCDQEVFRETYEAAIGAAEARPGVTPGRAAYEETARRVGSEYDSWSRLPADLRQTWEAAARAAIGAAELTHDADLRALETRLGEACAVVRDMLLVVEEYGDGQQDRDLIRQWCERAGIGGKS